VQVVSYRLNRLIENKNFYDNLINTRAPFLGLIRFSDILSLRGLSFIVKCQGNTIRLFVKSKPNLYVQAPLVFPYRLERAKNVEFVNGRIPLGLHIIPDGNMFNFIIKENLQEIHMRIIKILGKFYGLGTTVNKNGKKSVLLLLNPAKFFEIDLEKNPAFYIKLLDPLPKMMTLHSSKPVFESTDVTIGVDTYDPFQHTLVVGTSGAGKTKYLEILIRAVLEHNKDTHIVVIDPHDEFSKELPEGKVINFKDNYIEPLDTGGDKSPLQAQLIAHTITSTIGQENKYAERVVFYAVHLLASIDKLTLKNINFLLTDSTKRAEFASQCDNEEVKRFFDEEFQDIYMQHFNDSILPITNFIGEYLLFLGGEKKREKLNDLVEKNRLTIISFNPHYFGRNMIKFFAASIVNQMYTLAINGKITHPTLLMIDEAAIIQTKIMKNILAESRKFNLYLCLSAQYLNQFSKEILDSVMGNVRNIIAFKVTKEDARILSSTMEIKVEEYFKKKLSPSELEQAIREMFINLDPQECIVRLFDGKKYILPMKVKTVDMKKWENEEKDV